MKKIFIILTVCTIFLGSCTKDLLDQTPTDAMSANMFWKTVDDASKSVTGVYAAHRDYFGVDYQHDMLVDICRGPGWKGNETGSPDGMRSAWDGCYKIINRANVTLEGIGKMIPQMTNDKDKTTLIRLQTETRFLRAMSYFRLVDFFGAVPYLYKPITQDEAIQLSRTPIEQIRDSILADLNFSVENLPGAYDASNYGRATKWAALSFRGKFNLFWACWLKNRPEWSAVNEQAATYYTKARDDFKTIMDQSGHGLFKNGEPGIYFDPNYRQLFSLENEMNGEIIFSVQFTGPLLNLGSQMKAIFGSRQLGNNGAVQPTIKLMDLYLKLDGTKAAPLIASKNATLVNGAINRASYVGRDWRMRASVLWDGEKVLNSNSVGTTWAKDSCTFLWGNKGSGGLDDPMYYYTQLQCGYAFRKWFATYIGYGRYDTPQDFYLVRYADILLMYCEAVNEVNNGPTGELQSIINLIRHRGNITPSTTIATMSKQAFFDLLVNERAVEFVAEGQRFFDIRRWRMAETIWNNGAGFTLTDSWGVKVQDEFVNAQPFQFQRFYLSQIPPAEILMNRKMTQNEPWL